MNTNTEARSLRDKSIKSVNVWGVTIYTPKSYTELQNDLDLWASQNHKNKFEYIEFTERYTDGSSSTECWYPEEKEVLLKTSKASCDPDEVCFSHIKLNKYQESTLQAAYTINSEKSALRAYLDTYSTIDFSEAVISVKFIPVAKY